MAKDGVIFLERAVGSFGGRTQRMQLAIPLCASRNFQSETGMLCNRHMGGIAKLMGAMKAIAVKIEIGRKIGFNALLEAGKGKPLSGRIKTVRPGGKMAVRNKRPAVAVIAAFKESLACQFFIPGIVVN